MRAIDYLYEQARELIAVIDTVEELAHKCVAIESFYRITNILL